MNAQERDQMIAAIADNRTDNASPEALADYFYQGQVEHLDELDDDAILSMFNNLD